MKISKIEVGLPSKVIDNEDILELLKLYSPNLFDQLSIRFRDFTNRTGTKTRFWRGFSTEPHEVLLSTAQRLLSEVDQEKIDVVISCSVTKYVAEPSHASLFCKNTGLKPSFAYDVSDGCMGWVTALDVLKKHAKKEGEKLGLIISHEFPMGRNAAIFPKAFEFKRLEETSFKFPALTIGEATTLTLVKLCKTNNLVEREELPDGAELCMVPFRNYEDFFGHIARVSKPEMFHAYYNEMSLVGARPSIEILKSFITDEAVNLIPHAYTHSFEKMTRLLKFDANIINYFSEYGNIATSTIPLSLSVSMKRGDLNLAHPIILWCASAGIKIALEELYLDKEFS